MKLPRLLLVMSIAKISVLNFKSQGIEYCICQSDWKGIVPEVLRLGNVHLTSINKFYIFSQRIGKQNAHTDPWQTPLDLGASCQHGAWVQLPHAHASAWSCESAGWNLSVFLWEGCGPQPLQRSRPVPCFSSWATLTDRPSFNALGDKPWLF